MPRQGERGKERFWRRILRQWRGSGQSVRAFCAEHQLSEPSFYGWRRSIAARNRQGSPRQRSEGKRRALLSEQGKQDGSDRPRCVPDNERGRGTPIFVPVRVTSPSVSAAAAALEVVLRDGRVLRVPAGFDAATLRLLLAVLNEVPPC